MERDVSPPATSKLKRRRENDQDDSNDELAHKLSRKTNRQDTFRVFSWNINGISPFLQQDIKTFFSKASDHPPKASLRAFLHRHHFPELLFLQEVKINAADQKTQNAVAKAVNARLSTHDTGPDYDVHFTLPKDKHNIRGFGGKVYGVCSMVRRDFAERHVARVRDVNWDLEGRVSVVELKSRLAVWNIYAVNGTDNPYRDPETGEVRGTRHDRKIAFHRLLVNECRNMEAEEWLHVIAGDLNVAPARIDGHPNLRTWPPQHVVNRADFNEKFLLEENERGLQAVDVWRKLRADEKRYTYYPRGRDWGSSCDRVDLILASRQLWQDDRVIDAGIFDSPQERGPSDHVPLWVKVGLDISTSSLKSQSLPRSD